jgi:hypothetical protein
MTYHCFKGFKTPLQRSRAKFMNTEKRSHLFEARTVGHEFVTTPCLWFLRGEPQAKLLGGFESTLSGSTATLFGC